MKTKYSYVLAFLFIFIIQGTYAQNKAVSGVVSDANNLPLPGVNIVIKGTSQGTQTDFDGKYAIEVAEGNILSFSYVGFTPQEVTVGASSIYDVMLEQDASELDEVVVTALGIKREQKALGYAVQQVDGEVLSEARSANPLSSLSGQVAGVQISNSSGNLGGSTRILLRGVGSITQDNRPLIVVDGIPLNNNNFTDRRGFTGTQAGNNGRDYGDAGFDINPDDIETINVLKGGAAAALYGSRANNGVIIITTKTAKQGKEEIILNSGLSFESVNILPKVQKQYGGGAGNPGTIEQSGFNTATINGQQFNIVDYATDESWGPRYDPNVSVLHWDAFDPEFPDDFLNPRPWVYPRNDARSFFQTGLTRNNNIAFSKSYENVSFRASVGNVNAEGIYPNSELDKTTFNFNGSAKIAEHLSIDAGVNYTITEGFNRPEIGYTGIMTQIYQFAQTSLDYGRLRNYILPNGQQRPWNRTAFNDRTPRFTDNPYWSVFENTAQDRRDRWYGNLKLRYDISDKIYTVANLYTDSYDSKISERVAVGSQATSQYLEIDRRFQENNYEFRLHYDDKFNDIFSVNTFVGANRREDTFSELEGLTQGGLSVPGIYNLTNSNEQASIRDFDTERRINSIYGSVSFGYKGFAFIEATGRNDWSSTLPLDNNSYFYPSVSGSLVFSSLVDVDWLSFGKIRAGWASVGNDTAPNRIATAFDSRVPFLGNIRFSLPNTQLNPNLQPEEKNTWEVGLEAQFFDSRFGVNLTYYDEVTNDLITPLEVDASTGFSSKFTNVGSLSNKGVEALVNITPIQTDDFEWKVLWNFSRNVNRLESLAEGVESLQIAAFPFQGVTLNAVVGEPYGVIRGTNYVFDSEGNRVVDGDGRYLETPNVENLGSVLPDYNMGFRNTLSYKGIDLSFLIDIQKGGRYRSLTNIWGHYSGILEDTAEGNIRETGIVLEGVTGDVTFNNDGTYEVTNTAPNTQVISAQQWGQDHFFRADAQNVFDADYAKLREITLGYSFPAEWTGFLDGIKVTAFGRNLLVWNLDNPNFDPEVATSGSGNIQGSEGAALPSTRTYGFNVQLKF